MIYNIIFCICFVITSVLGAGQLLIFNAPSSISFKGNTPLDSSLLKEVYSAAMGYTVEKNSNWNGMFIHNPFNYPEALIHLSVDGVASLGNSLPEDIPKFQLNTDEDEYTTWKAIKQRVYQRHPEDNNTLVRIELSDGLKALNEYPWLADSDLNVELSYPSSGELQVDFDEDRKFLEEIAVLNAISQRIKTLKNSVHDLNQDIYWIVLPSLHALSDLHGPNSKATVQAQEILIDSLKKLTKDMQEAYNGKVLISVTTSDSAHTRRGRRSLAEQQAAETTKKDVAPETATNQNAAAAPAPAQDTTGAAAANVATPNPKPQIKASDVNDWNLAADYSENYPVIFHIVLWLCVAFLFSLLAVSYVIATMDPGRDSIIYRMTSNRMKKEN